MPHRVITTILTFAAASNALGPILMPWPVTLTTQEQPLFDWNHIEPSTNLVYHDCSSQESFRFSCARLLVPIDWQNPQHSNQISLAVIKLHGNASNHDPIFFNPGGPGGSGILALQGFGPMLQEVTSNDETLDMISFDPRGVGHSTNIHCYDSYVNEELYLVVNWVSADVDAGMSAVKEKFGRIQGRLGTCKDSKRTDITDVRQHMTSAHSAQDMLHILKLEHQAQRRQAMKPEQLPLHNSEGEVKLNYIGTSYGTMLGVTFASMFPEHTGKMLLDGNIDGDAWVSKWPTDFVNDFESIWDVFSERCLAVRGRCKLWRPSDRHPKDIMKRVNDVMVKVKHHPISVHDSTGSSVFTATNLRFTLSVLFYQSSALEAIATMLNTILEDTFAAPILGNGPTLGFCSPLDDESRFEYEALTLDAWLAIMCGDAEPSLDKASLEDFQHYVDKMQNQSITSGARLAEWRLYCMAWQQQFKAEDRFPGPFGAAKNAIDTPILFLNNRHDPVTPIINARSMSKKFAGSVVLEQDAVGHCALFSATGPCVRHHVKNYFRDGTLPAVNTVCASGCRPFEDCIFEDNWYAQRLLKVSKLSNLTG